MNSVELAGRIKRAFEKKSREAAAAAETEEAAAAADRDAMKGARRKGPHGSQGVQEAHTKAVQAYARIREQWDAWHKSQKAAEEAREKLKAAGTDSARSMQDAQESLAVAKDNRDVALTAARDAKAEVARIESELKAAKACTDRPSWPSRPLTIPCRLRKTPSRPWSRTHACTPACKRRSTPQPGASVPMRAVQNAEIAVEDAQEAMETGAVLRNAKGSRCAGPGPPEESRRTAQGSLSTRFGRQGDLQRALGGRGQRAVWRGVRSADGQAARWHGQTVLLVLRRRYAP